MRTRDLALTFSCSERWEDMPGDERTRSCAKCKKDVVDLSARSALGARLALAKAHATSRSEGPCVRYAAKPDGRVQFRPSRLAAAARLTVAAAFALWPAVARSEEPAPTADVHLCSPPAQRVVYVGGIERGLGRLLPDFGEWVRALKPQGDAQAHLTFDPARWSAVSVKCEGSLLSRHERTRDGEVTVYDLPDGRACSAKLTGEARTQRIDFVAGDTFTETTKAPATSDGSGS